MQRCFSCLVESDYKFDFPMDVAPLSSVCSCQGPKTVLLHFYISRKTCFLSRLVKFVKSKTFMFVYGCA